MNRYIVVEDAAVRILIAIIAGLLAAAVAKGLTQALQNRFINNMRAKHWYNLQISQYKKLQRLPVKTFDLNNQGYFYTRLTDDAETSAQYKTVLRYRILSILIGLSATVVTFILTNWFLGLIALAIATVGGLILASARGMFKKGFKVVKKRTEEYNTMLANSINGVREIKNFNAQDKEVNRYSESASKFRKAWLYIHHKAAITSAIFTAAQTAMVSVVAVMGAKLVLDDPTKLGVVTILLSLSTRIMSPIGMLLMQLGALNRGKVATEKVEDLMKLKEENTSGRSIDVSKGKIVFKGVYLSYTKKITALKNINLTIKPGENIAIVGRTGSGKSTLLKALVKHYPITSGSITIDGQDISKVNVDSLRKGITYISQENYLTNSTIRDNIIFAQEDFDENMYKDSINRSESGFINRLKSKDETMVGPEGVKLSGGQKQRITIARGLFKPSKIVLFDESTSALDNITERNIQKNIKDWVEDKTTITIAHRLSTIRDADRILVMEDGSIVEQGTHNVLVKRKGYYFSLLNSSEK